MTTFRKQQLMCKESIKKHFWDYCKNTAIHEFKYIGEQGRSRIERIWWIFVFGLSMASSTYLIYKMWHNWHNSAVFVSFSETPTPIWQIPFPTVTICSEIKVRQRIFNFSNAMINTNLSEDEEKKRDAISLICSLHLNMTGSKFTDESTIDLIKKVSPQLKEMMFVCKWTMYLINCSRLFTPVMTEEGICYTFNSLNALEMYRDKIEKDKLEQFWRRKNSKWSLEKGYEMSVPLETEPRRVLEAGTQTGIVVVLLANKYDLDYFCCGPVQGFKILLHNPAEIPRLNEHYFRLPHNQDLFLSVKPNMMTTSESLRSYQPSSRQCYFPSERYLAYYKFYNQRNCELECLTNYTLKKCQCAALYMPRLKSTQLCGAGSKQCMQEASDELKMEVIMLSIQKNQTLGNTCDCLPACTLLQYDAEVLQTNFNWIKLLLKNNENMSRFDGVQLSRVSIYFNDVWFVSSRRRNLYGIADFLANCGGLLYLFSGISVLSLIEIIYYITLRFYSNMRRCQTQSTEDDIPDHHILMWSDGLVY